MIIITMDADAGLEFLNRLSVDLQTIVKFLRFNTKLGCWLRSHSTLTGRNGNVHLAHRS